MNSKEKLPCHSVCLCIWRWCHQKATDGCGTIIVWETWDGERGQWELDPGDGVPYPVPAGLRRKSTDLSFLFLTQKHARIILQVIPSPCQSLWRRLRLTSARRGNQRGKIPGFSKFIRDLSVLRLNCLSFYLGHLRPPACLLPLQFRQ